MTYEEFIALFDNNIELQDKIDLLENKLGILVVIKEEE